MAKRVPRCLAAVFLLALLASARAEDQRVAGSKLVLRQSEAGEHLVLLAREGVVAPLPGGSEDPTLVGAVLEVSNPRTGERARFETTARDWTINAIGTVFRFRNSRAQGPGSEVRALVIKHRRRLKISTRALGITLDEEAQRALSVVLAVGSRRYCLLFGGTIGKDRPGRFTARNAPAPSACPGLAAGTSTTTTTSQAASTSTTKAPTIPTTTSSRPPATSSTVTPTTSTSTTTPPPGPTTSTSAPGPTSTSTSSSTTVSTTSSTTSTGKPCSFRGNSCKGWCPQGSQCSTLLPGICACL